MHMFLNEDKEFEVEEDLRNVEEDQEDEDYLDELQLQLHLQLLKFQMLCQAHQMLLSQQHQLQRLLHVEDVNLSRLLLPRRFNLCLHVERVHHVALLILHRLHDLKLRCLNFLQPLLL